MQTVAINPQTPSTLMKHYLLLFLILLCCSRSAHAGWFSSDPAPLNEAKAKIASLENQFAAQVATVNRWQIAAGSLAVACVILLIIGAALGSSTRKHHNESSRRLGRTSPPTRINGRKPSVMGEADDENAHSTLAA